MGENSYMGNLKFLGQDENRNFYVQIEIIRDNPNENGWNFENPAENGKSFLGTPLLCAYLPNQIGDGHNYRERRLPTGEVIQDFTGATAERIVGAISDDPADLWTETREDGTWVIAKGKIWRFYNRQLADKLAAQGSMAVSAEIETHEGYVDDNGIEVFTRWTGLGVTLLHESVPPAVPGAHIQAIKAMSKEFEEMKLAAASYRETDEGQDPEAGTPDQTRTMRGVESSMSINRREAERLAPLFEGYHIVGLSADSESVVLMSKDTGKLFSYAFNAEDNGEVVSSRIVPVKNVSVMCSATGDMEGAVPADLDEIVCRLTASVQNSESTIANLNAQIETLKAECAALRQHEHDRRIEAVNAAIDRAQDEIEESCDNAGTCEEEAAECRANAEVYAAMEKDGTFCGHDAAYDYMMSAYGKKVAASQKAEKTKRMSHFAWEDAGSGSGQEDGISGLLSRING